MFIHSIKNIFLFLILTISYSAFSQEMPISLSLAQKYSKEHLELILFLKKNQISKKKEHQELFENFKTSNIQNIRRALSIYENDDIKEIQNLDRIIKNKAQSVGIIANYKDFNKKVREFRSFKRNSQEFINKTFLIKINNKYKLNTRPFYERKNICDSVRFRNQPTLTNVCTVFAFSDQYLLTAGHCTSKKNAKNQRIAFGYMKEGNKYKESISSDNIFSFVLYKKGKLINNEDYAILKIKPKFLLKKTKIPKHRQTELNLSKNITNDENIYIIGHPLGLPLKYSNNAKIKKKNR